MSAGMQLLLLGVNFLYGALVFIGTWINYYFIKNETILVKILLTSLFAIDFTILYLVLIYKINYGIFNYYYFISFSLGFYFSFLIKKRVNITTIAKCVIDFLKKRL